MPSYYVSEDLPRFSEVGEASPELFQEFNKWYGKAMGDGKLDAKTKKLIAFAVAHAIQCSYCIDAYAQNSVKSGWTPEQMTEAVHVAASIKAGTTLIHNVQAINALNKDE